MDIRLLKPNEIDVRVQSTKKTGKGVGCILLLYKDARCDMKILDETFGNMNWQRTHEVINGNLFCNIEIWDKEKNQWIKKQDVGTESNTEKEKGQASDSFKRACFNLGIGRELYTSPFVWINLQEGEYSEYNGKLSVSAFVKFNVKSIGYNEEKEITSLEIEDNKGAIRYALGKRIDNTPPPKEKPNTEGATPPKSVISDAQVKRLYTIANKNNISKESVDAGMLKYYKTKNAKELTKEQYQELCDKLDTPKE